MYNCYSIGSVINDSNYTETKGNLIGYIDQRAHIHYLYGQDNINSELNLVGSCPNSSFDIIMSDTSLFSHHQRTNTLLSPVSIDSTTYNDLLDALNAWVVLQNNPNYKTWTINNNTGYPTFGDNYVPSCYNPTDVTISNATIAGEETIRTQLSWHQEGEPIAWEILYVDTEQKIENGTIIEVNTNPCILSDIPVGRPLDFYVRAVCSDNDMSMWSEPITYIPDKLHWTEVVTAQPVGYTEDEEGNVFISSAEGLAWLSSVVNHLNGAQSKDFWSKTVYLLNDIDVSEYRWTPIGNSWENRFTGGTFDGKQHKIIGLYCNELSDNMGLFGCATNGCIKNISILHCNVLGENKIGAIVGWTSSDIINCSVEGNVYGIDNVGGLVGKHDSGDIITIANSFYIGEVAARRDITKENTQVGYVGGICGVVFNDSIVNCYVVSQITDDGFCSGIITGTGSAPIAVKNCYYKDYNTNLLVTSDNCIRSDNSSFIGGGTSWTLNTSPYVNGAFRTDLLDALNAWVDENNTYGQYRHWVIDTAGVNGGYPIFTTEETKYVITFCNDDGTILQQDTLKLGEMPEYRSKIPTKDSTEQYNYTFIGWDQELVPVTKNVTYHAQYEETLNQYEVTFYDWDGTLLQSEWVNYGEWPTYYNSDPWRESDAQYTYTFVGWGNVSQVTGNASYYAQYEATINQYEINFYDWDGTLLQSEWVNYGEYPTYTGETPLRASTAQCTYTFSKWSPELTIVTSNAIYTAQYSEREEYYETACDEFYWNHNGETYYESGDYEYYTTTDQGCERIEVLRLTINKTQYVEETVTACDSYNWNGETYTTSGEYTYTTTAANGCDSVVTLHLTISNSEIGAIEYATICYGETYIWNGQTYAATGEYSVTLTNAAGCDSIATLHLTIMPESVTTTETVVIGSDKLPYTWRGNTYLATGRYTDVEQYTQVDCDSAIHVLDLTVLTTGNFDEESITICETETPYMWYGESYTATGKYTYTEKYTGTDIDSVQHILNLTVNPTKYTEETITACDSYTWNGETFTTGGEYTYNTTAKNGCDSIVTLHLTINKSEREEYTAVACDEYWWHDNQYTESGNYTYNTTTADGCERVEVLHLTILPKATTESEELALCPSELPYEWYGQSLTEEGTYSATEQYAGMECDSIIHELTLNVYVQTLPAQVTLPIVRTGEAIDVTTPTAEIQAHIAAETWYAPNALVAWYVMNNSNWTALTDEPVATGITEVILKYAVETDCGNIESDKMVIAIEPTGVENTNSPSPSSNCQKILYEDHIYILREGKVYSVMGHEM